MNTYRTTSLRFSVTELKLAESRLPPGHLASSSLSLGHVVLMSSVLCCVTLGLIMSNGRFIWLAGTVSQSNLRIIQPLSSVDLTAANKLDAPMHKSLVFELLSESKAGKRAAGAGGRMGCLAGRVQADKQSRLADQAGLEERNRLPDPWDPCCFSTSFAPRMASDTGTVKASRSNGRGTMYGSGYTPSWDREFRRWLPW